MRQQTYEAAHLVAVAEKEKWRQLAERQQRQGFTDTEVAAKTGLSREQVGRILSGKAPRTRSLGKIERAIDEIEAEGGAGPLMPPSEPEQVSTNPQVFRIRMTGVYGAAEVMFEGPVEAADEVRHQVDIWLRGQHEQNQRDQQERPAE